MKLNEFQNIIASIKPGQDIISGRRGSEENVKIKIVLPLLQYLGYDIIKDMDFELLGADIVIVDKNHLPILIIETKAWEQQLSHYLNQCLEYTFKLKAPYVLITSGQHNLLYSSLTNFDDLGATEPLIEFSFNDLIGQNSNNILSELNDLIGRANLFNGANRLTTKILQRVSGLETLNEVKNNFLNKCRGFKSTIKTVKITENDFINNAKKQPTAIFDALCLAKDEFNRIACENNNFRLRYRSEEIGLEYLLSIKPRSKILGLIGMNPKKAKVAFGLESWKDLKITAETLGRIKSFPRFLKTNKDVIKLVDLLENAIREIKK